MKHSGSPLAVLWKKELHALCLSPATAAGILFFVLGTGIPFFTGTPGGAGPYTFAQYVARIPFVAALVLPAFTMGIWSLERKQGTDLLLFSLPVSDRFLVLGKFCALLTVWAGMLVLTLPVLLTSGGAGPGTVFSTCLLLFFYGAASLAAGQILSVLFSLPAVAFLVTAALLLALNTVQAASISLRLSFAWHLEAASRGILDSRDILFYILPAAALLEVNTVLLNRRRIRP